jgi:ubiquinone/menaquinone biosynthesis C-methylase UbiE
VITSETPPRRGLELRKRYSTADVSVLTQDEARRFVPAGAGDPRTDIVLAWELLYRLEPELYDRLATAERLHPGVLQWMPRDLDRIVEVAAGTGRLTLELVHCARNVVAIEPAKPLREVLNQKLARADHGYRADVIHGFFDQLPVSDDCADLVVACSAFTPAPGHGGEAGLAEMERVCSPGGCVVIVWPNRVGWLAAHGYRYVSFDGEMFVEFASREEAAELTEIFYPAGVEEVRRRGLRRVPYDVLGINPPRDLAFKVIPR